jgi:hypothetical protein
MELYQEVTPCPVCGTRLTLSGEREPGSDRITSYAVNCPVCWTAVVFALRGMIDPAKACLVCYERPLTGRRSRRMLPKHVG